MGDRSPGRGVRAMLVLAAGALAVAGCASAKSSPPAAATTSTPPTTPTTTRVAVSVDTATNAKLGTILVDANGATLYRNMLETGGRIVCTAGCAQAWPPLLVTTASAQLVAGSGLTGALAMTQRPDGGVQVTYNSQPLYRFAGDHGPGDAMGQGVGGVWSVVSPSAAPASVPTTIATTTTPAKAATPPVTPAPSPPVTAAHPASPPPPPASPPPPPPTPPPPPPPTTSPPRTTPPTTACAYPPCY